MWAVREELGVHSVACTIERRTLLRIGHLLRMPNERMVKRTVFGWYPKGRKEPAEGRNKTTTPEYYRQTLRNAGVDPDTVENSALDRTAWRNLVNQRIAHIVAWERDMAKRIQSTQRNQRIQTETSTRCVRCQRECATPTGLKLHIQKFHGNHDADKVRCDRCERVMPDLSSLRTHQRSCYGTQPGVCPFCQKQISVNNIARHRRTCNRRPTPTTLEVVNGDRVVERPTTDVTTEPQRDRQDRTTFSRCNGAVLRKNLAKHQTSINAEQCVKPSWKITTPHSRQHHHH